MAAGSKKTAGWLGILIGGIGVHQFYMGKTKSGIIYVLLCWTGIPALIGFIQGIKILMMSDEEYALY